MNVLVFFRNIVADDKENNAEKSREIADSIGRFLVFTAFVNGDFTIEEANALREISDMLLDYCDYQGVTGGKERKDHAEMVTLLNRTGYYQPSAEHKVLRKDADTSKDDREEWTITMNVKLAPEQPVKEQINFKKEGGVHGQKAC